ncbi:dCTP pyrophosphatase 1 [Heracleum sosnowskyi]|uniref:dCTP pyrophosphatase 1 n=1 Tax=Heracleum sosnowskyi TaxID=360622 RepID=A0AAD8HBZ7_9APIA|nr:dCTP pyrophosphatase 1 [Heracleum sosnowskyi]
MLVTLHEAHNQREMDKSQEHSNIVKDVSLQELRDRLAEFARARDWEQYHSPRNLLLALVGEVGELSEIFQWKGEVERGLPNWSSDDKEHLEEELSDVLLYLVQLADVCGLDLGKAALSKILKNAQKYPPSSPQVKFGSSQPFVLSSHGLVLPFNYY